MGALDLQTADEFKFLARSAIKRESAECFGRREIDRDVPAGGGMPEQTALERRSQFGEAKNVDGDIFSRSTASAANRAAGQDELLRDALDLSPSPILFIAGKLGHVGEVFAQAGVPGFELGQQLVANAIARKGEMAIGRVLAPRLVAFAQICFDFDARCGEERTEDLAFRKFEYGMNTRETFGPGTAEEFGKNGFGLVVVGVGCGDRVYWDFGKESSKPGVAEPPCGFFDRFALGFGFVRRVDTRVMKGDVEFFGEGSGELEVGVGFFAAETVVQVGGVEDEA